MQRQDLVENKWYYDQKLRDFASFLGLVIDKDVRGHDESLGKKIEDLYVWGKIKAKSINDEKIKEQVFALQKSVGTSAIGKTLVDKLWQHVKFDSTYKPTKKEIDSLIKEEQRLKDVLDRFGEDVELPSSKTEETPEEKPPATIKPISDKSVSHDIEPKHEVKITETKTKPLKTEPIKMNNE